MGGISLGGIVLIGSVMGEARAQTVTQSETSIGYLRKTACIDATGPSPVLAGGACLHDDDCAAPATCEHRSLVTPAADLYVPLAFPPPPVGGSGPGIARYVPLCEDGSGDHEHAVSGGRLGRAPTCAPEDYIRCADGTRPYYHFAPGARNDWLIWAGDGGSAQSPGDPDSEWQRARYGDHYGAYTSGTPNQFRTFTGIFRSNAANPFHDWNRVYLEKCVPDTFLGDADHPSVDDALTDITFQEEVGACVDANGDTYANCEDNLTVAGSCACATTMIAPPSTPDHTYAIHYHGRRMVRALAADVLRGIVGRVDYPLVDDGAGNAVVQVDDVVAQRPNRSSTLVFACHSSGCRGLQGGMLDDLHDRVDAALGGPTEVWGLFNKAMHVGYEVEAAVSEWDGTDVDHDGFADTVATIDDAITIYDHLVDTVAASGEPMSTQAWEPGGEVSRSKDEWYQPRPGYSWDVDASCLQTHCPGTTDPLADPACTPCVSAEHVGLNHLRTPYVLIASQEDATNRSLERQCMDPMGETTSCNYDRGAVNLVTTHYRPLVRKQLADLHRYGATSSCEAASGPGGYDRTLILALDSASHAPLTEDAVASITLDPAGPVGPTTLADAVLWWFDHVDAAHPRTALCLQERYPGENASDFGGTVPGCQ